MRDSRVDVGDKIILRPLERVPEGCGFIVDQFDLDDGLVTLEAIFPGDDQADLGAVLLGLGVAIDSDCHESQLVHGFLYRQRFCVRPRLPERQLALRREGFVKGRHFYIRGVRFGLDLVE